MLLSSSSEILSTEKRFRCGNRSPFLSPFFRPRCELYHPLKQLSGNSSVGMKPTARQVSSSQNQPKEQAIPFFFQDFSLELNRKALLFFLVPAIYGRPQSEKPISKVSKKAPIGRYCVHRSSSFISFLLKGEKPRMEKYCLRWERKKRKSYDDDDYDKKMDFPRISFLCNGIFFLISDLCLCAWQVDSVNWSRKKKKKKAINRPRQ